MRSYDEIRDGLHMITSGLEQAVYAMDAIHGCSRQMLETCDMLHLHNMLFDIRVFENFVEDWERGTLDELTQSVEKMYCEAAKAVPLAGAAWEGMEVLVGEAKNLQYACEETAEILHKVMEEAEGFDSRSAYMHELIAYLFEIYRSREWRRLSDEIRMVLQKTAEYRMKLERMNEL